MTISTDAGFDSAAAAPALGIAYLVELNFASGVMYLTNWPVNITVGSKTYTGLGNLGRVGQMKESEDGATQSVELELSQVAVANLSAALGSVNNYQNRSAVIYVLLMDTNLAQSGSPALRFSGFMDILKIKRDNNNMGVITLVCKTGGYDVRKNPTALRLNDSQHQALHPGELGFQYVATLIAQPQMWLSKRFQSV